jgi:hypothetical protein
LWKGVQFGFFGTRPAHRKHHHRSKRGKRLTARYPRHIDPGRLFCDRQAKAILDDIRDRVKQNTDARLLHIEGEASTGWVLMDYGDVVVHLFSEEMRNYYDLEGLWQKGRVVVRML